MTEFGDQPRSTVGPVTAGLTVPGSARVSAAGRQILAAAVSIDHNWALRFSSEDKLTADLADLPDQDLDGAYLLACHLQEAIACIEIRQQMARSTPAPDARPSVAPGGTR